MPPVHKIGLCGFFYAAVCPSYMLTSEPSIWVTTLNYRVVKMRFGKNEHGKADKSVIRYNDYLFLTGISLEVYEYVVNGRSAIEWIMDRYEVTTDKASGIVNDPNKWAEEHDEPRYIVDLLKRVVRVSIRAMSTLGIS